MIKKVLQIVNFDKFEMKITSQGSFKKIADDIKVAPCVVRSWFSKSKRKVQSKYIEKLQKVYNLTLEDLGAEEVEIKLPDFWGRLEQLLNENNINQTKLAETLDIANSNISQWKKNKRKPQIHELKALAEFFDVSIEYLLGISNIRNLDNSEMADALGCTEYFINFLKDDTPTAKRNFMGEQFTSIDLEEKYFDLKEEVFGDVLLLPTLKAECDRVISYYTSSNYYYKFEDCINETDIIGQTQEQPVRYDIENLAHSNISYALNRVFDEYVDMQLTKIYKEKYKDRYNGEKLDQGVTQEIKRRIASIFLEEGKEKYKKL